jgi:hypothetical protein
MCTASEALVREGTLLRFDAADIDRRVRAGRNRWPATARADGSSARACASS